MWFQCFRRAEAVFLVSILDCCECDSSGLDHLNSSWSIARLREYFRRKIGHCWTARRPNFLNGKRQYIIPSTVLQISGFSVTSAIVRVWIWILETQVGASLVWKSTWEEKEATVDCRSWKPSFLNAKYLSIVTWHTHCMYTRCSSKCNLRKKSLLAQTSPALQPLPLAFCQLPKVSGVIIWPMAKLPKTTDRYLYRANLKMVAIATRAVYSLDMHACLGRHVLSSYSLCLSCWSRNFSCPTDMVCVVFAEGCKHNMAQWTAITSTSHFCPSCSTIRFLWLAKVKPRPSSLNGCLLLCPRHNRSSKPPETKRSVRTEHHGSSREAWPARRTP